MASLSRQRISSRIFIFAFAFALIGAVTLLDDSGERTTVHGHGCDSSSSVVIQGSEGDSWSASVAPSGDFATTVDSDRDQIFRTSCGQVSLVESTDGSAAWWVMVPIVGVFVAIVAALAIDRGRQPDQQNESESRKS